MSHNGILTLNNFFQLFYCTVIRPIIKFHFYSLNNKYTFEMQKITHGKQSSALKLRCGNEIVSYMEIAQDNVSCIAVKMELKAKFVIVRHQHLVFLMLNV